MTAPRRLLWILIGLQLVLLVALVISQWVGRETHRGSVADPAIAESVHRVEARLEAIERRLSGLERADPERLPIRETDPQGDAGELRELADRVAELERGLAVGDSRSTEIQASLRSRMSEAIRRGSLGEVLRLVSEARDPDLKNADGLTPLLEAAKAGDVALVRALVRAGAVVDRRGQLGRTPLIEALSGDQPEVAIELIDCGGDIGIVDQTGETAMVWAAWRGHLSAVRRLVSGGADPNAKANGNPPIVDAIRGGHLAVVRFLVAQGADVNLTDAEGATPLANARSLGKKEIVAFLESRGAR